MRVSDFVVARLPLTEAVTAMSAELAPAGIVILGVGGRAPRLLLVGGRAVPLIE